MQAVSVTGCIICQLLPFYAVVGVEAVICAKPTNNTRAKVIFPFSAIS
jgi:hypothetical protein